MRARQVLDSPEGVQSRLELPSLPPSDIPHIPHERFAMDHYYNVDDLAKFGEISEDAPEPGARFFEYYNTVFKDGELSEREKALIALAVAHTVQCPYCIDAFTRTCLEKGSNLSEMTEALHVAAAIRAGSTLVHAVQMRTVANKLSM